MKIFIEGTPLFRERTGVGQYTHRLLSALFKQDKKNDYTIFGFLFFGKSFKNKPFEEHEKLTYRLIRYLPSKIFNALIRKFVVPPIDLMLASKPDIFLFPNFVRYPLAFNERSIVIVYDLSYILHGQYTAKRNREYLLRYVPGSLKKSSRVVTISENSKQEIIEHYGINPEKITIVSPAIDHDEYQPQPKSEIDRVRSKYGISTPRYILYTGTLEPRKNILGILDAYAQLPASIQTEHTLVLAGGKGWLDQDIKQRLSKLSSLPIITTGYVDDTDLPGLYSGAAVFVYPSFYEGFGMPPLEAMACGAPVITSNNSSLPEVVGDAGILINADDTSGLATNITTVLTDKNLSKAMRAKGLEQAKKFNWDKSAKVLLELIESLA